MHGFEGTAALVHDARARRVQQDGKHRHWYKRPCHHGTSAAAIYTLSLCRSGGMHCAWA